MIKLMGRLGQAPSPMCIVHMGDRIENEQGKLVQDKSFRKNPRFVIKQYVPDLRFGQSPPIHEGVSKVAIEKFAGGNPEELKMIPVRMLYNTPEQTFQVKKMSSCGFKKFNCVHNNPVDCGDEDDPRLIDVGLIQETKTPTVPIITRPGMPKEWHHGHVAHRTIGRERFVVPCPEDPHDCPFGRELSVNKKTGKQNTWKDGSPTYDYSCNMTGILHVTIEHWYPLADGHLQLWPHGWDSIRNLSDFLNKAQWLWGKIGLTLPFIGMELYVKRSLVTDPNGDKKPQPVLFLRYDKTFSEIRQKALGTGESILQLAAGRFVASEGPRQIQAGEYSMPEGHQNNIVTPAPEKEYTLHPPEQPPASRQSTGNGDEIKGGDLVKLKKAAKDAGELDAFVAAASKKDQPALRALWNKLVIGETDVIETTATPVEEDGKGKQPAGDKAETRDTDADKLFDSLWKINEKSMLLPPKSTAIKDILLLDKDYAKPSKLPEDHHANFSDEMDMLATFIENGGTLETAADITGVEEFKSLGWFGATFRDKRELAVNTLIDKSSA